MKLPGVKIQFDGTMLLTLIVAGLIGWLWLKKKAIADTVTEVVTEDLNPASQNNIIYQGAQKAVGEENLSNFGRGYFSTWEVLIGAVSPWHEARDYAKENAWLFGTGD